VTAGELRRWRSCSTVYRRMDEEAIADVGEVAEQYGWVTSWSEASVV